MIASIPPILETICKQSHVHDPRKRNFPHYKTGSASSLSSYLECLRDFQVTKVVTVILWSHSVVTIITCDLFWPHSNCHYDLNMITHTKRVTRNIRIHTTSTLLGRRHQVSSADRCWTGHINPMKLWKDTWYRPRCHITYCMPPKIISFRAALEIATLVECAHIPVGTGNPIPHKLGRWCQPAGQMLLCKV